MCWAQSIHYPRWKLKVVPIISSFSQLAELRLFLTQHHYIEIVLIFRHTCSICTNWLHPSNLPKNQFPYVTAIHRSVGLSRWHLRASIASKARQKYSCRGYLSIYTLKGKLENNNGKQESRGAKVKKHNTSGICGKVLKTTNFYVLLYSL